MKPKLFIGSSVEGLSVAYAIQQNLTHDSEPTVWDQGVFELSLTTIEALTSAIEASDFGVFVFSPDDVTLMRGNESKSIRDNVLFEFGLFIGRLGRNRVFYIIPDGSDVHIPSDLLGITPGKYNPDREDGSLQAATGPACNQIREKIKQLSFINEIEKDSEADQSIGVDNNSDNEWLRDLTNNEFTAAEEKLEAVMKGKTGDELLKDQVWLLFIKFRQNEIDGLQSLMEIAEKNKSNLTVQTLVSKMFLSEHYNDKALEILDKALLEFPENSELSIIKSGCLSSIGDNEEAINNLIDCIPSDNPNIAVALAELYENDDDLDNAIEHIHAAYINYPSNESVAYKYSRLLQDNDCNKEALYLLNYLTCTYPKNVGYWGYLSNICVELNLYNKAMEACKEARELSEDNAAWILHNIGNMLNNKGFYSDAIEWLNKGLVIEPSSEYAHNRLAGTIKNKKDEHVKFKDLCKEGRVLIRNKYKAQEET